MNINQIDYSVTSTSENMRRVTSSTVANKRGMCSDTNEESKDTQRERKRTREQKKTDRIMANRRSAKESRERRKALLNNLQGSVCELTETNTTLLNENAALQQEILQMKKRRSLRKCHAAKQLQKHPTAETAELQPFPLLWNSMPQQHLTLGTDIIGEPMGLSPVSPPHHITENIHATPNDIANTLMGLTKEQLAALVAHGICPNHSR